MLTMSRGHLKPPMVAARNDVPKIAVDCRNASESGLALRQDHPVDSGSLTIFGVAV